MLPPRAAPFRGALPALFYASFAASGAGCALAGVLLPLLRFQADDERTGGVFFLIALGAALGPVALGRHAVRGLALGYALIAFAATGWAWRPGLPEPYGFCWGLGLGMVMTALSLTSSALPGSNGVVLMRLNFLWAVGAWACPSAVGLALHLLQVRRVPLLAAVVAALLGIATTLLVRVQSGGGPALPAFRVGAKAGGEISASSTRRTNWSLSHLPAGLVLATALAPGIEAAAGAWLATYASRTLHTVWFTLTVPACFWGGLLVSRAFSWWPGIKLEGRRTQRGLLLLVVAGAALLLLPEKVSTMPPEAFLLGFGLGPLYPVLLARVLKVRPSNSIFLMAGLASSVMPWATGLLSHQSGSLQTGLLVPLAGAAVLLGAGWRATRTF